jgi:hypothetical protein
VWSFAKVFEPDLAGKHFALFSQFWLDLRCAQLMMCDQNAMAGIPYAFPEAMNMAVADTWLYAANRPNASPYPGDDARECIRGSFWQQMQAAGGLSLRLTWECASTVDELCWQVDKPVEGVSGDLIKATNFKIKQSSYGLPWTWAEQMARRELHPHVVLALVDFATNPPLPFLLRAAQGITWRELYPASRFTAAATYSAHDTAFEELCDGSDRGYLYARRALEEGTGLRYGVDEFGPDKWTPAEILQAGSNLGFFEHASLAVSRLLLAKSRERPSAVIGYLAPRGVIAGITDERAQEIGLIRALGTPFVLSMADGVYKSDALTDEQAENAVVPMWTSNMLDELVHGSGRLAFDYLPPEWRQDEIAQAVREHVEAKTGSPGNTRKATRQYWC